MLLLLSNTFINILMKAFLCNLGLSYGLFPLHCPASWKLSSRLFPFLSHWVFGDCRGFNAPVLGGSCPYLYRALAGWLELCPADELARPAYWSLEKASQSPFYGSSGKSHLRDFGVLVSATGYVRRFRH